MSSSGEVGTAIGLDVGGTKIAAGVVSSAGQILSSTLIATPAIDDGAATLASLEEAVGELRAGYPGVQALGVGAAGLVDWPSGRIRWAPNNAYRQLPLRDLLQQATGLPTVVENDANMAAWGEAQFGAGAYQGTLLVLTVGTGVGGGVVVDGQLFRGTTGIGAEVGHLIVNPGGAPCGCGNRGCLEAMASGQALGRRGREVATADPGSHLAALAGGAEHVTGQIVFQAASEGDMAARQLFEELGYWLGIGIASLVTVFDPELVVVGGGLIEAGELLLEPARRSFERNVFARQYRDLPPVVPARLGPHAGLVGAANLALLTSLQPPSEAATGRRSPAAPEAGEPWSGRGRQ
jgi:glucokinase